MLDYLNLFVQNEDKTCFVIENGNIIFSSTESGVKPLIDFYNLYMDTKKDLIVVDRIMGKGAVLLAILINARTAVTYKVSEAGIALARKYNLDIYFNQKVDYIINKTKNGPCPIESSLLDIDDIEKGFKTILKTLKELAKKSIDS